MKNITLCKFLLLCLGSMPLLALKGKDDDTAENPKPVAAAASPSTSQATTPAVAKAPPRKVLTPPESFVLTARTYTILQSKTSWDAQDKKALLEKAEPAVKLKITYPHTWSPEANQAIAPLTNVRSLVISKSFLFTSSAPSNDLPLLPCPEKLESLSFCHSTFQTIQNITHYTNLHTLRLSHKVSDVIKQDPHKIARLAVLAQLQNLRTLHCGTVFTLDHRAPDERKLFIQHW